MLAPAVGFEPTTKRLTAARFASTLSTIEILHQINGDGTFTDGVVTFTPLDDDDGPAVEEKVIQGLP